MLEDHSDSKPTANAAYYPTDSNIRKTDTDISRISDTTDYYNVTSLLVSDFNLMGDYPEAKDSVTAALMALNKT